MAGAQPIVSYCCLLMLFVTMSGVTSGVLEGRNPTCCDGELAGTSPAAAIASNTHPWIPGEFPAESGTASSKEGLGREDSSTSAISHSPMSPSSEIGSNVGWARTCEI